ncbi:MAG: LysM peptidoglycan-binding domain-containing protein [Mobilitalea sp.]
MVIHVVQPGEKIVSIAETYGVSVTDLYLQNGLINPNSLVVGQAIVIVYPKQTYTVLDGDSLVSIAEAHRVTIMQLLRNNPYLFDREFIYPGETIIISYNNDQGQISTNGYAYPFIKTETLKKTLPFLTYLSIFNYRVTDEAEIIGVDDTEIIQIAKQYGIAPIMLLSTMTYQGVGDIEVVLSILNSQELVDHLIDNILNILRIKGYYGVNTTMQFLTEEHRQVYENYVTNLTTRLNNEGYLVFVTLTPWSLIDSNDFAFEKIDYTTIGKEANVITLLTYNWGSSFGPPAATTPVYRRRTFFDYVVTMIPPEKILSGISVIGYDWQLPYEVGVSKASSLNYDSAIILASQYGAIIQFDDISQAPYFEYTAIVSGVPIQHIVWFTDARSVDALVKLILEYGFMGANIWNIMQFFPQLWLVINSQYEIVKVLPELLM